MASAIARSESFLTLDSSLLIATLQSGRPYAIAPLACARIDFAPGGLCVRVSFSQRAPQPARAPAAPPRAPGGAVGSAAPVRSGAAGAAEGAAASSVAVCQFAFRFKDVVSASQFAAAVRDKKVALAAVDKRKDPAPVAAAAALVPQHSPLTAPPSSSTAAAVAGLERIGIPTSSAGAAARPAGAGGGPAGTTGAGGGVGEASTNTTTPAPLGAAAAAQQRRAHLRAEVLKLFQDPSLEALVVRRGWQAQKRRSEVKSGRG